MDPDKRCVGKRMPLLQPDSMTEERLAVFADHLERTFCGDLADGQEPFCIELFGADSKVMVAPAVLARPADAPKNPKKKRQTKASAQEVEAGAAVEAELENAPPNNTAKATG